MKTVKIVNDYNSKLSTSDKYLIDYWISRKISCFLEIPTIIPVNDRIMLNFCNYELEGVLVIAFNENYLGKFKRQPKA